MKFLLFILGFVGRNKNKDSLFASALKEGAKDLFREMGYTIERSKSL